MMPLRTRLCLAVLLLGIVACDDATPVALVPLADPFVYNGPAAVTLPLRALDRNGRTVLADVEAVSDAPEVVKVEDQHLRCLRTGDAQISAKSGTARTSFQVQCRPIASFAPPWRSLRFDLADDPVPLAPTAFDSSGQPLSTLRFTARSEDSSVASVVAGRVVPRAIGSTRIHLDFGGITHLIVIDVVSPMTRDTVRLVAGEYRHWPLGPGRYVASITGLADGSTPPPVAWRSANANCAFDSRSRSILHCVLDDSGAVIAVAQHATTAVISIDRRAR
jgi:hypothetical protein